MFPCTSDYYVDQNCGHMLVQGFTCFVVYNHHDRDGFSLYIHKKITGVCSIDYNSQRKHTSHGDLAWFIVFLMKFGNSYGTELNLQGPTINI